tara:strand:- start:17 stop:457 length:441 start_codon:yes stop_codon:yes gene_type:complete
MNDKETIEVLTTVVKTLARKLESMDKKIDTIENKISLIGTGIKEMVLPRLWNIDDKVNSSSNSTQSVGLMYTGSISNEEVVPAKYKRITIHLQELQAMYSKEDEWERNFIQSILDFSGQTVTEKQLKVLNDLSQRVDFEKELVTIR